MQANVLVSTLNMDRQSWLEIRKGGIGGSDAAAIAGLSKYKSPVVVYLEKTGQLKQDEPGEAAYWGNVLEDIVAKEFSSRTGLKVKRRNAVLQHPEYPFMLANVDRLIVGEQVGLECKTASAYLKELWEGDEVPIQYLIQCQHYMAVTGFQSWWIAVLVGGNTFIHKKIDRDEELIAQLIDIEKNFWENHVLAQVPPVLDGSEASTELLKKIHPVGEPESETELPLEADDLLERLDYAKSEAKAAEERVAEIENQLKAMIGDFETGIASQHIITWKNVESRRIDSKALKTEHPDIYERFAKVSTSRRFSVKVAK
ncbi:YqaJ viral recombinase family protein [Aneurinibacillus sp. Ricciae_BoGa-3]|uniref:YqaJ viral recombinase family nuclease n=1 Tax=Aneurinibacillus sp. Ricciae_BoGa-3 TaxID=3022697 RepID=UPI0023427D07|nr:YqaJ viral recombinase family protein [Aneurinibacillus sp. Ricciae_BoGa-3]WCK53870.1 YqaJ viral recombinase family protein [Aneurinibacillus sp. Ricciae_BoGa-3]